jgi:serine/threonine protein kinase
VKPGEERRKRKTKNLNMEDQEEDAASLAVLGMSSTMEARFHSLQLIGKGSFGDVFKGFDKELNKEVAIKVIDLEEA